MAAAAPRIPLRTLTLDWIVPSPKGEDAPLSTAALLDSQTRLEQLQLKASDTQTRSSKTSTNALRIRVAHGLPFNGYLGTSIHLQAGAAFWRQLQRSGASEVTAHLALVELIPAGADGTPIARILARNLYQPRWNIAEQLAKSAPKNTSAKVKGQLSDRAFYAFQPISIPEGAKNQRLAVVGWLENSRSELLAIAQSACAP
jgi:hypothetical protein